MMQNATATDPRGVSLDAEIRFTQYRLDTTSDIGDQWSALARMRVLRDVLTGLTTPRYQQPRRLRAAQLGRNPAIGTGPYSLLTCLPGATGGSVFRPPASLHAAEGNDPYSILKDLNSYDDIVTSRGNPVTQQMNRT